MKFASIALAATIALCTATLLAQSPMREGSYEITMQMQMPNMPMQMPTQKLVHCVTKKDLEDPAAALPSGNPGQTNSNCKVSDHKTVGNKVTWNMSCSGPQPMTGSGEIVVNGDSYVGTMKMNMDKGEMTMKYNAKRLGDCTK